MKNLVLGSLMAVVASQAAGCIIETSDSGPVVDVSWSLKHYATNETLPCPPGTSTAAFYAQPVDANGNDDPSRAKYADLFNCDDDAGVTDPMDQGLWLAWVELANDNNTQTYAKSLSTPISTIGGDTPVHFDIIEDGGYFQMQWSLRGASTNATLTCAQAGVASNGGTAGIQLQAFVSGSSSSASDLFNCEDGYGVTDPYLAGSYDVLVDAVNPNPVGSAPNISSRIDPMNKVTNLGTVTIPINGL